MSKATLGVCYYPEHWPESQWAEDARRMADMGLTWVRIGEFAWAKIEPKPGALDWGWLDRAVETLASAGLKVVMGTPTATPPRWMIERHPDMIAVDIDGKPRKFGSRRHYCFSHLPYRQECARIVELMAKRYGPNPAVQAWQTDNEYGCHDTTLSYSEAARQGFRVWLQQAYGTTDALNQAWGNVFWSMDYHSFDEIELPNLTVTEPNPSHALAFRRYTSNQVVAFNKLQVDILRQHTDAPIGHNYMGRITDFDHFKVGDDLDFASWDSYPLGFLEDRVGASDAHKRAFMRQGDPDFQALHHDLYRAVGKGRWWVMEQQPGPVNWAPYNPEPLPGMVRCWSWEAIAHGAEAVCYFRWRQAPFAQEQMHAGLLRPDSSEAAAFVEGSQVAQELEAIDLGGIKQAPVAIVFDYDADFTWTVQPQGQGLSYFGLVLDLYRALRSLGLSVDILPCSTRDFSGYKLILVPGLMSPAPELLEALEQSQAPIIYGPRTGAKTAELAIPDGLPPQIPGLDISITHVETLRPDMPMAFDGEQENNGAFVGLREALSGKADVLLTLADGKPALVGFGKRNYLAGWPDQAGAKRVIREIASRFRLDLELVDLPQGLRCRDTQKQRVWLNYADKPLTTPSGHSLAPAGVHFQALDA